MPSNEATIPYFIIVFCLTRPGFKPLASHFTIELQGVVKIKYLVQLIVSTNFTVSDAWSWSQVQAWNEVKESHDFGFDQQELLQGSSRQNGTGLQEIQRVHHSCEYTTTRGRYCCKRFWLNTFFYSQRFLNKIVTWLDGGRAPRSGGGLCPAGDCNNLMIMIYSHKPESHGMNNSKTFSLFAHEFEVK